MEQQNIELRNLNETQEETQEETNIKKKKICTEELGWKFCSGLTITIIVELIICIIFIGCMIYIASCDKVTTDGIYREQELCIPIKKELSKPMACKGEICYTPFIEVDIEDQKGRKAIYDLNIILLEKEANEILNKIELDKGIKCWVPDETTMYNKNTIEIAKLIGYETDKLIILDYDQDEAMVIRKWELASFIITMIMVGLIFFTCIAWFCLWAYLSDD